MPRRFKCWTTTWSPNRIAPIRRVSSWMEYIHAVLLALKDEAEAVMARNPELKEDFDAFVSVWGKEYVEALEQAVARNRNTTGKR